MYTTMAFVALTLGNLATTPTWQNDYATAQQQVSASGKPMVVFVGSGKTGPESVIREGAFSPDMNKVLSQKFVCLYVDTTTASGQELSKTFGINKGVVISDRTGSTQAFSLAGQVSADELSNTLLVYQDVKKEVKKTATVVKDPKVVVVTPAPAPTAGCGQTYGGGYGKGWGGKWGGGCCGKGWGGGSSCGQGTVVVAAPAPVAVVPAPRAPATVVVAQPASAGCGKGWGGGYAGAGWGKGWGGGCGKGWGGGYAGGGCSTGYRTGGCK